MAEVEKLEAWAEHMGFSTDIVQSFLDNFDESEQASIASGLVTQLERYNPNVSLY